MIVWVKHPLLGLWLKYLIWLETNWSGSTVCHCDFQYYCIVLGDFFFVCVCKQVNQSELVVSYTTGRKQTNTIFYILCNSERLWITHFLLKERSSYVPCMHACTLYVMLFPKSLLKWLYLYFLHSVMVSRGDKHEIVSTVGAKVYILNTTQNKSIDVNLVHSWIKCWIVWVKGY